jgi:hypothetical protein
MSKSVVGQIESPLNLYKVYRSIKQRAIPKRCKPVALNAAIEATQSAERFINKPSEATLLDFQIKEKNYLRTASASAVSYAKVFENALQTKNYVIDRGFLKIHKLGWNPCWGTVYTFSCDERSGCVKIGATEGDIKKTRARIKSYSARYGYSNIKVAFIEECSQPALVESLTHDILNGCRDILSETKSNEWYRVSEKHAINVLRGNLKKIAK